MHVQPVGIVANQPAVNRDFDKLIVVEALQGRDICRNKRFIQTVVKQMHSVPSTRQVAQPLSHESQLPSRFPGWKLVRKSATRSARQSFPVRALRKLFAVRFSAGVFSSIQRRQSCFLNRNSRQISKYGCQLILSAIPTHSIQFITEKLSFGLLFIASAKEAAGNSTTTSRKALSRQRSFEGSVFTRKSAPTGKARLIVSAKGAWRCNC